MLRVAGSPTQADSQILRLGDFVQNSVRIGHARKWEMQLTDAQRRGNRGKSTMNTMQQRSTLPIRRGVHDRE